MPEQEQEHAQALYYLMRVTIQFTHLLYVTRLDILLNSRRIILNALDYFNKYPIAKRLKRKGEQFKQIRLMAVYLQIIACGHRH